MTTLSATDRITVRQAIDRAKRQRVEQTGSARGSYAKTVVERELVQEIVSERPRRAYRECPYCGHPCTHGACPNHWDLIALDLHNPVAREEQAA